MNMEEIEYFISDIVMKTEEMTLLQFEINNSNSRKFITDAKEQLQLLYINRELSKQELMSLGE
jgi:hypothetical protein